MVDPLVELLEQDPAGLLIVPLRTTFMTARAVVTADGRHVARRTRTRGKDSTQIIVIQALGKVFNK